MHFAPGQTRESEDVVKEAVAAEASLRRATSSQSPCAPPVAQPRPPLFLCGALINIRHQAELAFERPGAARRPVSTFSILRRGESAPVMPSNVCYWMRLATGGEAVPTDRAGG